MAKIPERWEEMFSPDGDLNLISSDLLTDMLKEAAARSRSRVTNCRTSPALWEFKHYNQLIGFIFDLVTTLGIEQSFAKYNACDLFEEYLNSVKSDLLERDYDDSAFFFFIHGDALTRLVACLMLSTKLNSTYSVKSTNLYSMTVKKFGHFHTITSHSMLMKAEIDVLKTVNFQIDQCPLHWICPLLIATLNYNEPTINGKSLYSVWDNVMDRYYLAKDKIMAHLYEDIQKSQKMRFKDFRRFVADSMLISCAIVAVTPMLIDEKLAPLVLQELVYITCYGVKDIELVRNVIHKCEYASSSW